MSDSVNLRPPFVWEKLGRIFAPDPASSWYVSHTGASFARPVEGGSLCDIYVTGRDKHNRSHIGCVRIDLNTPGKIISVTKEPLFSPGELGCFDENGVSYPWLIENDRSLWMYYVGWMPSVRTPYQTHVGLARRRPDGTFERVSRAPILERTDDDPLAMGSVGVLREGAAWRMWYTSYRSWGQKAGEPKHRYLIKSAESSDGIHWKRDGKISIGFQDPEECAICRPSVVRAAEGYHMWYAVRGAEYRIGYAFSPDGLTWTRHDEAAGIAPSAGGWDAKAVTYPHVFQADGAYYLLYCGNEYGKEGLGLARLKK